MTIGKWLNEIDGRSGLAVEYKNNGDWHKLNWSEYLSKVIYLADFLEKKGLQQNQHVGIMSATRWEWAALDLAILGLYESKSISCRRTA